MFFKSKKKCVCCSNGTIMYEPGAEVGFCDCCNVMQTLQQPDDDRRDSGSDKAGPDAVLSADTASSVEQIALCLNRKADSLTFGKYIQKPDGEPEPIEWQVLTRKKDCILVLSRYALDCRQYNEEHHAAWDTCTLRSLLNGEFLDFAFSEEEKALIPPVFVSASDNPKYDTDPGDHTKDRVFLLSVGEVGKYLGPDSDPCRGTVYCNYVLGRRASNDVRGCPWWLRTPGTDSWHAAYVGNDGDLEIYGNPVYDDMAVRPAMWLTLKS
ncbi:MAG: DUF6273 domain-containing protein [Lachnospiraceae bacterium]|nr:DUF6273 domain-containing protein [Lachnospiraceae bacterium]